MLDATSSRPQRDLLPAAALAIAALGALTILGAYVFQYVLGYPPCPLCLEQRTPYYIGIPLALVTAFAAWRGAPRAFVFAGLAGVVLLMLWGAGLGIYHAGIEWKWWAGPQDCSGPISNVGGNLLNRLESIHIVRCDEAAWRFLGLSLAGYNVLITLSLAAIGVYALASSRARPVR